MTEREEQVSTILEFNELKKKFYQEASKAYPNTGQPVMCWLFDTALGLDPRLIAAEPISKKKYYVFIPHPENPEKRLVDPKTGKAYKITRYFTPQEQKIVRDWWVLLPDEMKV